MLASYLHNVCEGSVLEVLLTVPLDTVAALEHLNQLLARLALA